MKKSTLRSTLLERGLWLEYVTLGWNVVGTAIVVAAAFAANSVALAGFGLDSLIEIFASVVVVWHLKEIRQDSEHMALRPDWRSLLPPRGIHLGQSARTLLAQAHPETSFVGLAWLSLTFVLSAQGGQYPRRQPGKCSD